jgi:uncharacterized Tic20 family protein
MNENMDNPTPQPEPGVNPPPPQPEPVMPGGEIPPVPAAITKDAKMWGMFCHLAALAGFTGLPFANVLGPLILWLIKKDEFPFVDDQGKESLNFQISMAIYALITLPLFCIVIGPFLMAAVFIFDLIMVIIASIESNKGKAYRYPLCIRLIK